MVSMLFNFCSGDICKCYFEQGFEAYIYIYYLFIWACFAHIVKYK